MKKAKTKTGSRKKRIAAKTKENRSPVLKERLEAEFAQAVKSAKSYVEDPQRLRALFQEAAKQAASLPRDSFQETWPYFQTMLRLIRAYYQGDYRNVAESTLVVIIAAIIYVVNPLDLIPDAIPALGFLDDATVLALTVRRTRQTLDDFMTWETATVQRVTYVRRSHDSYGLKAI
jgi:uncharacterized membrane protein YkvA (DUF1232 family)